MAKPEPQPLRRHGFCAGCQTFVEIVLIAPYRYRCDVCAAKETGRG